MRKVSMGDFSMALNRAERASNEGCTAQYNTVRNKTVWYVAGRVFGESAGPLGTKTDYWINEEN